MAVMLGNPYGALKDAGVTDEKAQKTAEKNAASSDVAELKRDMARIRTDTAVLKWMVGFTLAGAVTIPGLVLRGVH